jgi:hypothetical protein
MSALVHSEAKGDFSQRTDKSLVSSAAFHNEFYTYTVGTNANFQTVGTFSLVSGATASTCPAGRVLHLSGKKLFPDINPMNTFVGVLAAKKFLVGVYDPISFLSGFVDPTSNTFAKFDQNLPNFFNLGTAGSGVVPSLGGDGVDVNVGGALNVTSRIAGQVTLVAGVATVTVTGVTTSSLAFVSIVTFTPAAGGTVCHTAVCTANTVTIRALVVAGTANTADTSVVNYLVIN